MPPPSFADHTLGPTLRAVSLAVQQSTFAVGIISFRPAPCDCVSTSQRAGHGGRQSQEAIEDRRVPAEAKHAPPLSATITSYSARNLMKSNTTSLFGRKNV